VVERRYEISLKTVLLALGAASFLLLTIQLRSLFITLFVAFILTLTLNPLVARISQGRISRSVAVVFISLILLIIFGGAIAYGFTPMITQLGKFLAKLPALVEPVLEQVWPLPLTETVKEQLLGQLTSFSSNLLNLTLNSAVTIASHSITLFNILFFTFYLLLDWPNVKGRIINLFTRPGRKRIASAIDQLEHRLGGWIRGELISMALVGVLTFVALSLLGADYVLPLALIAAALEIVPMLGPFVAAVPAVIVGFASSLWLGLGILILYLIIQQIEGNIIVPQVMKKTTGFSPLATLIILFSGGELFGFGGVLLALPMALALVIVAREAFAWGEESRAVRKR
jgi:predicted PurR-regulated permease PerM